MKKERDELVELRKTCRECAKVVSFTVPKAGYMRWLAGAVIQDAMPRVSRGDRELLISDHCGPCFDRLFKFD